MIDDGDFMNFCSRHEHVLIFLIFDFSFQKPTTTKVSVPSVPVPAIPVPAIPVTTVQVSQPVVFYANQVHVSVPEGVNLDMVLVVPKKEDFEKQV